jgi:hypothetical protein
MCQHVHYHDAHPLIDFNRPDVGSVDDDTSELIDLTVVVPAFNEVTKMTSMPVMDIFKNHP